jgi:N-acetylmuramoyl-L-alanine amidase CwlA
MVSIKEALAHSSNYGATRSTSSIKYIVVHYTANDGDHDESNAKYFQTANRNASAHYFVDDDSITRSVKDTCVAWSVGGSRWADCPQTGGGKMYGKITNSNSISIEMCDTKKDGTIKATETTMNNTVDLIVSLLKKYNLKPDCVYRHFDVNGKHCPAYLMKEADWKKFKDKVVKAYGGNTTSSTTTVKKTYSGTFPTLPSRGYFKKGDTGAQVKNLQKFLNWAVNTKLTVDGEAGDKTIAAVKSFQKLVKLTQDGLFGKDCLAKAKTYKK